ncbi:hypothetical protein [Mesorhizobium mediterraneum]|uniref:hypothetical protein n=1 Tax=Mesorhizobium mediterraneum TaxID=43617 RepID=UPI0017841B56|nr:hypothetical protein [Mesorhizobium mediterraneum]
MKIASVLVASLFIAFAWTGAAQAQAITLDPHCRGRGPSAAAIEELINKIGGLEAGKGGSYDFNQVYAVLAPLNRRVGSTRDIEDFRCADNLDTIISLIELANINERTIRVNASLLLANVVDNTTLCAVLDQLFDREMNDNTRYNLWQIVLVVARYARVENKKWIRGTIQGNRGFLTDTLVYEKTLKKMQDVEAALNANTRSESLLPQYAVEMDACLALPNIATLNKQP